MEEEAASLGSQKCSCSGANSQLTWFQVQLSVFLTFLLLLCLYPVASLRRYCRQWRTELKLFYMLANAAILSLIPYTYGLIRNLKESDNIDDLVVVWAIFLLYVYVNVPDFVSFNDLVSTCMACVKLGLYGYYIAIIIYSYHERVVRSRNFNHVLRLDFVMEALVVVRAFEIMFHQAFLTYDGKQIQVKHSALCKKHRRPDSTQGTISMLSTMVSSSSNEEDPWLRCNYVVYQTSFTKTITVREIWGIPEGEGCILSSSQELKSYCLSLSLFWKLFLVFGGRRSYQSSSDQEEAWKLVRNGLLGCRDRYPPFRVIEVELALLYDYITNSSNFILYKSRFPLIQVIHMVRLVGIICIVGLTLPRFFRIGIWEVLITWSVVIASIMVELAQFIGFWRSRWQKMMLLCTYLIRKSWAKQNVLDRFIRKAAETVLCPSHCCGGGKGELFKERQTHLGQYSLLETYSYRQLDYPSHMWIWKSIADHLIGNRFLRTGIKESKSVSLTSEIKEAVINTLLARGCHLTNGIATLEASDQLSSESKSNLVWACTKVHTKAQVVFLWHIATSLCEIELKRKGSPNLGDHDFNVATSLSKYCAYLVVFAPDMLPAKVVNTNFTRNEVIDEAFFRLKKCKDQSIIYNELMEIADTYDNRDSQREVASTLEQGAIIGKVLITQVDDPRARWKVLADFWAEMILYLAPNGHNEWAHVERLADGGEFITQLRALLFHVGVVDRDSLSNKATRDPYVEIPIELV